MLTRRQRINQNKICKDCNKKGVLYLTKSTNLAFCFVCLKRDKNTKIRASFCTRCGEQKRTRRLPLHPPKANSCFRCSCRVSSLTTSFKSIIVPLTLGVILALAYRHRYTGEIAPITSLTFWLLAISGALGWYLMNLMTEEVFHKNINKEMIHSVIWGSGIGLVLWISGIFFSSNFLTWLICLLGGAIAGILYAVIKRVIEYTERYE